MKRLTCVTIATALLTVAGNAADDNRAADRAAIRAHIDRIFQAFIHKDSAELRATHAENWLGYLEGSREMIRGARIHERHRKLSARQSVRHDGLQDA